jgi:hypothetical protein
LIPVPDFAEFNGPGRSSAICEKLLPYSGKINDLASNLPESRGRQPRYYVPLGFRDGGE